MGDHIAFSYWYGGNCSRYYLAKLSESHNLKSACAELQLSTLLSNRTAALYHHTQHCDRLHAIPWQLVIQIRATSTPPERHNDTALPMMYSESYLHNRALRVARDQSNPKFARRLTVSYDVSSQNPAAPTPPPGTSRDLRLRTH